jgi:hypothetical protein
LPYLGVDYKSIFSLHRPGGQMRATTEPARKISFCQCYTFSKQSYHLCQMLQVSLVLHCLFQHSLPFS